MKLCFTLGVVLAGGLWLSRQAPAQPTPRTPPEKPDTAPGRKEVPGPKTSTRPDAAPRPDAKPRPQAPPRPDSPPKKKRRIGSPVWLFFSAEFGWHLLPIFYMEDTWVDLKYEWVGLVRAGVRWRFIEGDLEVSTYSMRFLEDEEVMDVQDLSVNAGFALYSYRGRKVRVRHGFRLGAMFRVGIRCRSDDPSDCQDLKLGVFFLPLLQFHVVDLSFRLADGVWLELSPLNSSMFVSYFYMISVGVRWEAVRLR